MKAIKIFATFFALLAIISCNKSEENRELEIPNDTDSLGTGWSKVINDDINYADIFFSDNLNGFLIGVQSNSVQKIFKSIDGGVSWQSIKDTNFVEFISMSMHGKDSLCLLGEEFTYTSATNGIMFHPNISEPILKDCIYTPSGKLFVSGTTGIYSSSDNGYTFSKVLNLSRTATPFYGTIDFIDDQNGWVAFSDSIYKTNDGGNNWTRVGSAFGNNNVVVDFLNQNLGFVNSNTGLFRSTDGGATWQNIHVFSDYINYPDIKFINTLVGFASTNHHVYKTIDGGLTWISILRSKENIVEIHFNDENHGWVCGLGFVFRYEN